MFSKIKPDLIFYQAGVDTHEHDRLGKLKVSSNGIKKRNNIVYRRVQETNAKCVITLGGGYPKNLDENSLEFKEIVSAHCDVYIDSLLYA